jgi:hypothetical protein
MIIIIWTFFGNLKSKIIQIDRLNRKLRRKVRGIDS